MCRFLLELDLQAWIRVVYLVPPTDCQGLEAFRTIFITFKTTTKDAAEVLNVYHQKISGYNIPEE